MSERDQMSRAWLVSHVAVIMSQKVGELALPNLGGGFQVQGVLSHGSLRPIFIEPWGVRVDILAAVDLPSKVAVLRELNDLCRVDPLIKWSLDWDGTAIASTFVVAGALENYLEPMVSRAIDAADEYGPMLVSIHGGRTPALPSA